METRKTDRPDPTADNHAGGDAATKAETRGAGSTDAGGDGNGKASGGNDWSSELRVPETDRKAIVAERASAANQETGARMSEPPADAGGDRK